MYVVRGALYVVGGWNRARHARWRIKSLPQATGHKPRAVFQTPTLDLPEGEGELFYGNRAMDSRRGMGPGSSPGHAPARGRKAPLAGDSFHLFADLIPTLRTRRSCQLRAGARAEAMATTNWPTTGYELQATCCFSRIPGRGWPRPPRSGAHAVRGATA